MMRRRPLLGAAVVVGASRSAARREVARQGQLSAEAQRQAEAAQQQRALEEQLREHKTELAIQAALAKERSRSRSPLPPAAQSVQAGAIGYCSTCGAQRVATDKFCGGCGAM